MSLEPNNKVSRAGRGGNSELLAFGTIVELLDNASTSLNVQVSLCASKCFPQDTHIPVSHCSSTVCQQC